ncbi:LOW QUALITY PROTEIN: hypothetical protein PHMEG_0007942 [Phytophthora megakarya]|uniref:Uncharacterized protein n=1 Tax=Phytophthora megakarya TaxID=4795 RepID=A0A225WM06_9STRA|nr:LOW QUALITY PROTEIN: hypothetical protein PHMEG_0007942 [Phytophthora megakarya]
MFNPQKFSKDDIKRLRGICQRGEPPREGLQLREGTTDQWKGLAEGDIVGLRFPAFVRRLFDSQEQLRLLSTIQAQVEGELMLTLNGYTTVNRRREHTRALKEAILLAAEIMNINLQELHALISQTKTIGYNKATKSIHFFFFDRASAAKYAMIIVPFKERLTNLETCIRRPEGQSGSDSPERMGRAKHHVQNTHAVDLEGMDGCTPESRTSTIWKVTFKLAAYPEFLQGIVRIIWFDSSIPRTRCSFTDERLWGTGTGGLVALEEEVIQLDDLAKLYSSIEDIRTAAVKCLLLQESAKQATAEALIPTASRAQPAAPTIIPTVGTEYRANLKKLAFERDQGGRLKTCPSHDLKRNGSSEKGENAVRPQERTGVETPSQPHWGGYIKSLNQRLHGLTIPHEQKKEIQLVLQTANPDRYNELLTFLVNTVSNLSVPEQERLLSLNLDNPGNPDVRQLLQHYQVPLVALQQWQHQVRENPAEVAEWKRDQVTTDEEDESDN